VEYEGIVFLSGSTKAWATIDDIESTTWQGTVRSIAGFDFRPGVVTVRLAEGSPPAMAAVAELRYDEELEIYENTPGVLIGRTPFAPERTPG
jgi:hypothetical protein